jgi:hypothetical protein
VASGCLGLREECLPLSSPDDPRGARYEVLALDPRTGLEQRVLPAVELGAARAAKLDMKWSNFTYSFVPASTARALGALALETLDLGVRAPAVPAELELMHGMNPGGQRVFDVVRIDVVDLGVGPTFGPVRALVLDDANSSFGLIGHDWASFRSGTKVFHHRSAVEGHPCGAVEWIEDPARRRGGR